MPRQKPDAEMLAKPVEGVIRVRQRQKLIDACISALYWHGPSRTTIEKVVKIAEMSPGIVNFYFETKAALMVAALDFLAQEFEDAVITPIAGLKATPMVALERLIELYLDPEIASPRKVSVWYSFWGESSSRSEYFEICGNRDVAFAALVRDLMEALIDQRGAHHLDADAVALGLIGALEMIWQEIAFREEADLDRPAAIGRCRAYLRSVFPPPAGNGTQSPQQAAAALWVASELAGAGIACVAAPASWDGCDLLARPASGAPQRIRVRSFPSPPDLAGLLAEANGAFEWLAVVLPPARSHAERQLFVLPRRLLSDLTPRDVAAALTKYRNNTGLDS